jgi:hypothetical protein
VLIEEHQHGSPEILCSIREKEVESAHEIPGAMGGRHRKVVKERAKTVKTSLTTLAR